VSGISFGLFLASFFGDKETFDKWWLVPVFITAVGGGGAAVLIDSRAVELEVSFRLRLVTAFIFGFFGAVLLLALVIVLLAALAIYGLIVESRSSDN